MSTQNEVIDLVAQVLEREPGQVGPQDRFIDDLGASSLDILTLVMHIEQHYALAETPDSQLEQIETVGDLAELVDALRGHEEPSFASDFADIAIASDHAGVELKAQLVGWLRDAHFSVQDLGPNLNQAVDYPDFAQLVAQRVATNTALRGILLCGSGIGMSIAANKVRGVRAALVNEPLSAKLARQHNDANVLCLGARMIGLDMAKQCIDAFMATEFDPGDDGRHRRRIQRIQALYDSSP